MNTGNKSASPFVADESYWQALLCHVDMVQEDKPASAKEDGATVLKEAAPTYQAFSSNGAGPQAEMNVPLAAVETSPVDHTESTWQLLHDRFARGDVFEATVFGYNRGGLLVRVEELQGFVPASQMMGLARWMNEAERVAQLTQHIGQNLKLKIIELDRGRNRLVLSERAVHNQARSGDDVLASLQVGQVCQGRVSNVTDFGAFVDLGGVEGLIHVSELSWERVDHPQNVLHIGDLVKVHVMSVDRERRRVALSLKRLRPDPWAMVAQRYQIGQVVQGTITNVVDFGAFARLEEGVEGLIHVSELAEGNFLHPRNVVREGDVVTARILTIDQERHRLGLSLRQVRRSVEPAVTSPTTPLAPEPSPPPTAASTVS